MITVPVELQVQPPDACQTMDTLRVQIDRIDQALVEILSLRQRYIERAAEIKDHPAQVRDEARIADVLAKVVARAHDRGLNESIVEPVFRTLVEASIALETDCFARKPKRAE